MKRILVLLCLTAVTSLLQAQQMPQLSEQSKITLLTCGPGKALYAFFGHSALRVYDPVLGFDRIYNYGTFDFNTRHFYLKFISGTPEYILSVSNYPSFYAEYVSENRAIREQILNLTLEERQRLFEMLEINYLPENRTYRYDFLFDNCSTRIRDIVLKALGDKYQLQNPQEKQLTFRQLLKPYVSVSPWLDLGVNLLLAGGTDKPASFWHYMFLPDGLERMFRMYEQPNLQSLVRAERTLFEKVPDAGDQSHFTPALLLLLLLLITILLTWLFPKTGFWWNLFDTFILGISSLAGLIMVFLWFFSLYTVTNANLNLFWALPLNLILVVLIWFRKAKPFVIIYSRILTFAMLTGLLLMITPLQTIPASGYLLFTIVLVRIFSRTRWINLIKKKPQKETN